MAFAVGRLPDLLPIPSFCAVLLRIGLVAGRLGRGVGGWKSAALQVVAEAYVKAVVVQHGGPTPTSLGGVKPFRVQD
jgi:hypothetical protein